MYTILSGHLCFKQHTFWRPDAHHFIIPNDDVIKLKHFPRYWAFLRGIDRSPLNSPHKGQ